MSCTYHTGTLLTITPTYVVATPEFSGGSFRRSRMQRYAEKNLKSNNHNGKLSRKAQTRIKNAVNWLIESAKYKAVRSKADGKFFHFKVNFITLTIPKTDAELAPERLVKRALHNWLIYARKYLGLRNYVWKIEQHKSGQLHIHLTTDTFIHYKRLRATWNKCLSHHGLLDRYIEKSGDSNPNSTDVHSVKHVRNLSAYIAKYMSKEASLSSGYKGRIWGCNYDLSASNKCQVVIPRGEEYEKMSELLSKDIKWKRIEGKPNAMGERRKVGEIYFMEKRNWQKMRRGLIKEAYDEHRFYIRSQAQKPPPNYYEVDFFGSLKEVIAREKKSNFDNQVKVNDNEKQTQIPGRVVRSDTAGSLEERQVQMHLV